MAKMLIISILFTFCNMALPKYILLLYCFSLAWNLSIITGFLCLFHISPISVIDLGAEHRLLGDEFQGRLDLQQRFLVMSV